MSDNSLNKPPMSSIPGPQWTDAGLILPNPDSVLAGVIAEMQGAFGTDLAFYDEQGRFLLARPQGQLATSWAASVIAWHSMLAYYYNQIDPDYARGRMQDALGKLYFMTRATARSTTVMAICKGKPGTIIPTGSLATDSSGILYASQEDGRINKDGSVPIQFACTQTGPISCPVGGLNQLYQIIQGWDSISNDIPGILGCNEESRVAFEIRRRQSVAGNAVNSMDAIYAEVMKVSGVVDAYVTENSTDSVIEKSGIILKPHSVYICVAGGKAQDVAKAIFNKKPPGCAMNGDRTVTIDNITNEGRPLGTYDITFQAAIPVSLSVFVTIIDGLKVPSAAEDLLREAVMKSFVGMDGSPKARIGSTVYASQFYRSVTMAGEWVNVVDIEVGIPGARGVFVELTIEQVPILETAGIIIRRRDQASIFSNK